jgi:hypothetical protein
LSGLAGDADGETEKNTMENGKKANGNGKGLMTVKTGGNG